MRRPAPLLGVLQAFGWCAMSVVLTPLLLPPLTVYRTCVVAGAVLLFAAALATPRGAFTLAVLCSCVAGVSALVFGAPEPAAAGPVLAGGYLAGAAIRRIYAIDRPPGAPPLLGVFSAFAAAAAVSAVSAFIHARTGYLLLRSVPPPHVVNVLGEDASRAVAGIASALASLMMAAAFHARAAQLSEDAEGRRCVDRTLVLAALTIGGVALTQKLGMLPLWRAARWQEWHRAQSTLTDPSAAGVAAALLIAPLLARAASQPFGLQVPAGLGVVLLLPLLVDAGSRAGLIGALSAAALFVLWSLTRLAAGEKPGVRRRVALTVWGLASLSAIWFVLALFWPAPGSARSALVARLVGSSENPRAVSEDTAARLVLYEGALAHFRAHPVVGIGLGGFRSELPNAAAEMGKPVRSTDNPPSLYLGVLAEMGVAGSLLMLLLLASVARSAGVAFRLRDVDTEEALRAAGAAAAIVGLLAVLLFGSHLVYCEIATLAGLLTAQLPAGLEGRTARGVRALLPLVLVGAIVLLGAGALARGYETLTSDSAFRYGDSAGVFPVEREPDGRPFRWTGTAAAWRIGPVPERFHGSAVLELPMKNARPDEQPVTLRVFWNDRWRGDVQLPASAWYRFRLPVAGSGVLRVVCTPAFRPAQRTDSRRLGIEVGERPTLRATP